VPPAVAGWAPAATSAVPAARLPGQRPVPGSVQGRRAACMQRLGCTSAAPASPAPELPSHCTTLSLRTSISKPHRQARLEAMGSHYGAHPAHDALWHSAEATAHSLPARLAVEHCVHEARGCAARAPYVARGGPRRVSAHENAAHSGRPASHCAQRPRARCAVPPHLLNGLIRCNAQNAARALARLVMPARLAEAAQCVECCMMHARGPYPNPMLGAQAGCDARHGRQVPHERRRRDGGPAGERDLPGARCRPARPRTERPLLPRGLLECTRRLLGGWQLWQWAAAARRA